LIREDLIDKNLLVHCPPFQSDHSNSLLRVSFFFQSCILLPLRSLLPLLEGNTTDWKDRHIFAHICRWPTGTEPNTFRDINFTVRNQRYRYVGASRAEAKAKKAKSAGTGPALYDMEADPAQTQNIIADHPEIAAQMKAAYDQYWKEARPLNVNESAPMSPTKPYHEWFNKQKATTGIPPWTPPTL
jgi:arylsulfatase